MELIRASCSKSPDNTPEIKEETLVLSAAKTSVAVNEELTFVVKAKDKLVDDASLYIDDEKITVEEKSNQ